MINLKLALVLSATVLLTACGGGGGSDPAPAPTPAPVPAPAPKPVDPPKITYYRPVAPQSGDQYLITVSGTTSLSTSSSVGFSIIQKVGQTLPDGSFFTTSYPSFNAYPQTALNDANFATVQLQDCSYAPARNSLPLPWYVGQVATQTSALNCPVVLGHDHSSTSESTTKVLSYEPITVPAGIFNTLKVKSDRTVTFKDGRLPTIIHETCWLDLVSGYSVQCKGGETLDATGLAPQLSLPSSSYVLGGTNAQFLYTQTLQSVTHADTNSLALTGLINNVPLGAMYLKPTDTDISTISLAPGANLQVQSSQAATWTVTDIVYATAAPAALRTAQAAPLPAVNYQTQSVIPVAPADTTTYADGVILTIQPPVLSPPPLNPLPVPLITVSADKRSATFVPPVPAAGATYPSGFTLTATSVTDPTQIIKIKIKVIIGTSTLGSNCTGALKFC